MAVSLLLMMPSCVVDSSQVAPLWANWLNAAVTSASHKCDSTMRLKMASALGGVSQAMSSDFKRQRKWPRIALTILFNLQYN